MLGSLLYLLITFTLCTFSLLFILAHVTIVRFDKYDRTTPAFIYTFRFLPPDFSFSPILSLFAYQQPPVIPATPPPYRRHRTRGQRSGNTN